MAEKNPGDDFIREVDEELQREQMIQFWKKYNGLLIGAASAVVLAVGGYNFWETQKLNRMIDSSAKYSRAMQLYNNEKPAEGDAVLGVLAADGQDGYKILADFRLASSLEAKERDRALDIYKTISSDEKMDRKWRDLAEFRTAKLLIDGDKADTAAEKLAKLNDSASAWRHSARDLLFAYNIKKGDYEKAKGVLEEMTKDTETPKGIRSLLATYRTLAEGGALGEVN
ncbi:MAG: tetratricopeptide repeat protein [Methylobacteriaceae bacterium]|jgi:hypothetical protein|nr:tetratricopeptide repeat protein [Methylobacteriaceae bacterium]